MFDPLDMDIGFVSLSRSYFHLFAREKEQEQTATRTPKKANLLIATFHTWLSLAAVNVPGKVGIISKSDQGKPINRRPEK